MSDTKKENEPNDAEGVGNDGLLATVFVYSSRYSYEEEIPRVKVLYASVARKQGVGLINEGWVHTATLNPAQFIEHLVNGDCAPERELDSLLG